MTNQANIIRVLVVDDSALARKQLSDILNKEPGIEVIDTAPDLSVARQGIALHPPDVIVLNIEMAGMEGLNFIKELLAKEPVPIVVTHTLGEHGRRMALQALENGAVEMVGKPKFGAAGGLQTLAEPLQKAVKIAAAADITTLTLPKEEIILPDFAPPPARITTPATDDILIAIGSSAGGVAALTEVVPKFPRDAPAVVMVQHMPAGFTASFARRLNMLSAMSVKEAEDGDPIEPGLALLAPGGDRHMEVVYSGGKHKVSLRQGEKVSGHQPSVDVLFYSAANVFGSNTVSALLTGMGADGAKGMMSIRQSGGRTFAQDQETCVVFGMPGVAWERGAAEELVPLGDMAARLMAAVGTIRRR